MKKQLLVLLLVSVYFLESAGSSSAARNISITSNKSSLSTDEELVVVASASGFTSGEKIYIKGAFFKDGSSNYFGLTKNNETWIKNSATALSQREVNIGSWDNSVNVKPDFSDTGFNGSGEYKFKLGFYFLTSGGNASSINWSSNDVSINLGSPPTSILTPTKVKTTSSSSSSNNSIKTPTPTKQSQAPTVSNSANAINGKNNSEFAKITRAVKAASEYAQIKPITRQEEKSTKKVLGVNDKNTLVPIIAISGIIFLLAGVSYLIIRELRERKII